MKNKYLKRLENKKLAMLGLGSENLALILYLLKHKCNCLISVEDSRTKEELGKRYESISRFKKVSWSLGTDRGENLNGYDIVFRSPGWPIFDPAIQDALKYDVQINSPIRLFFDLCPSKNIIGVTGTKGKGTTSSLIYHILKVAGKRVWFGGNIGVPTFSFLDKIKKNDWVVLEMSSFQLEDMKKSPHITVMTNFGAEHLAAADPFNPNYHMNMRDYWRSKMNLMKWQTRSDISVINQKLRKKNFTDCLAKKIFFTNSELESNLPGRHNKENIAAAVKVAEAIGINGEVIEKAVKSFRGLEHRIEHVATVNGISYYDDSFATIPNSTKTALRSFRSPIVLIGGGAEKNSSFKSLSRMIVNKVKYVILLEGKATKRFRNELLAAGFSKGNMRYVQSMEQAVLEASKRAQSGDIVLMSPACASFGMFSNYKERGNMFKSAVLKNKKRQSHK